MAYREVTRVEIGEVIRRWQAGEGLRRIATSTGLSRVTGHKYVAASQEVGLSRDGPEATEEQLSRLAAISQSGPRQCLRPPTPCWPRGQTRSTSGSQGTGCK